MTETREQFEQAVQEVMLRKYGIGAEGPIHGSPGQTAEEWADRYSEKYDLIKPGEMTLEMAVDLFRELGFEPPFPKKTS